MALRGLRGYFSFEQTRLTGYYTKTDQKSSKILKDIGLHISHFIYLT